MTERIRNALSEIWGALTGTPSAAERRKEWQTLLRRAETFREQGDFAIASVLAAKALELMESDLGPEHPDVGAVQSDLGRLRRKRDRQAEAELLQKALGLRHPAVENALVAFASIESLGWNAQAERLFGRAPAIHEKAFGLEDPGIAASPIPEDPDAAASFISLSYKAEHTRSQTHMKPKIAIRRKWFDVDDHMAELAFEVCDGKSLFSIDAYVNLDWGAKAAAGLRSFGHEYHGGLFDLEAGGAGPEYAGGAFRARFHFYRPTMLLISTFQQAEHIRFKKGQVASEARMFLRTEPALLDRFIGALAVLDNADGEEAVLECVSLY